MLVEVAREPFLILDSELKVIIANDSFYHVFATTKKETENRFVYDLGDKQWDISELRRLLDRVLPEEKTIIDYEVNHDFPKIGKRTMLLNARQLDSVQLIILAFEDVTEKRKIRQAAKDYEKKLEKEVFKRTKELNERLKDLEEITQVMVGRELKMSELKEELKRVKKLKKRNGNNGNKNT